MTIIKNVDIQGIVKVNFKIALFDAIEFDYFRDDYEECEARVDALMEKRLSAMPAEDIQTFALALIDGDEVVFDKEKDDFYLRNSKSSVK